MTKAILTDIEGTTSSLSFVKDVLFPYSRARMAAFIHTNAVKPEVRAQLDDVSKLAGTDLDTDRAIAQLIRWIDEDKKITPLKVLQGMIWEAGYRNGDYKGHVYEDTPRNLKKWKDSGLRLYVFSSGSVFAQKLIFGFSEAGDLTPLFSGYFDTTVGNKREAIAYRKIANEIGLPPQEILFLSDIVEELDAAHEAGMQTMHVVRDTSTTSSSTHQHARNFDEIHVT